MDQRANAKQMFRFMAVFGKQFLFKNTLFFNFGLKFFGKAPKKSLRSRI